MDIKEFAKLNYSVGDINNLLNKASESVTLANVKDEVALAIAPLSALISELLSQIAELLENSGKEESPSEPEPTVPTDPDPSTEEGDSAPEENTEDGVDENPDVEEAETSSVIISTVPELSGICLNPEKEMYGVSDSLDTGESGIYKINKETGETELFVTIDADLEGITCDTEGNFYVCTEDLLEEVEGVITHKTWNPDEDHNFTYHILKVTPEKQVSIFGTVVINQPEATNNKGLEGIAYYGKSESGAVQLLIGVLKKPTLLMLWDSEQGKDIAGCQINGENNPSEIADLYYDGEYLYILDSKTAIVYKYSMEVTETTITLTLILNQNYSDIINMDPALNDGDGENPEALCMDNDTMYIGCDYNSKIYKVSKI